MNLTSCGKVTRVSNAATAAQTAVNSSSVDMQSFEAVTFLVSFGAITSGAVTSVKAQQSADDSSWADLEGTAVTVADDDDNQVVVLEIHNPQERYVRCVISRGTQDAVVDGVVAIQTGSQVEPVTHDTVSVVAAELHHAPEEGTA